MAKFAIDEGALSHLETLDLLIKNNLAGAYGGNRKSRSFGSSAEFADYRDYLAGDDITKIDWKAFARFDKLYQRLYYDERQMHTKIYIDVSRSMGHGDGKKARQALTAALFFAYLSVSAMDKVSIYAIREGALTEIISRAVGKDSFMEKLSSIGEIEFEGESRISEALLSSELGRGDGLSVIISDFLCESDYEMALDALAEHRRDVLCIQILSREEINPQIRGKMHLFDSENLNKTYRKNIDREIAEAYKKALSYVKERISSGCQSRGQDYLFLTADDSILEAFFGKLIDIGVLK